MTIQDWVKLVLNSNVVAAIIVGSFGVLTLKMGIGKFRSEKWWERKAEAYVSALAALNAVYQNSRAYASSEVGGFVVNAEVQEKLADANLAGLIELKRLLSIGPFLMSKKTVMIIAEYLGAFDAIDDGGAELTLEMRKAEMKISYEAIAALRAEAKCDLRIS